MIGLTEPPDERPNQLVPLEELWPGQIVFSASGWVAYRVVRANAKSVEVEKAKDYRLSPDAEVFLRRTRHV